MAKVIVNGHGIKVLTPPDYFVGNLDGNKEIKQSSVFIIYHDVYDEWQVLTDAMRRVQEDCRHEGWGDTIPEAFANRKLRDVGTP